MDLTVQANGIKLVLQVFDRKSETQTIIPYVPQKKAFPAQAGLVTLPRATPESQGMPSELLQQFILALQKDRTLDLHTLMILRNGQVISETAFGDYNPQLWTATHSLCKSVTGLAIGMLIDDGKLNLQDRVVDLVKKSGLVAKVTHKSLTVRHLLTMSSGITFNELGAVTDTDWVKAYLESAFRFEPGAEFAYNSMNSYMLSDIVREVSGQSLMEYLKPRLFQPLQIQRVDWEVCPQGIEKGGWGMYLVPEDMAKIGLLYLQNGVWQGQQLISEAWIRESTQMQMVAPQVTGAYHYGYHVWVGKQGKSFLLNGMFGQNVIGFPNSNLLIVTTGGISEMFQQGGFFRELHRFFARYLPSSQALPENPEALQKLRNMQWLPNHGWNKVATAQEREAQILPELCKQFESRSYRILGDQHVNISLLPLIQQVNQNSYSKGLQRIKLFLTEKHFYIVFDEGEERYTLPIGFGKGMVTQIEIRGEPYWVSTQGEFAYDEDQRLVLKCRFSFLEIPNSRLMKIYFDDNTVEVELREVPGRKIIFEGLASVSEEASKTKFVEALVSKIDGDYLTYKIDSLFAPRLQGIQEL
jgi:CubicO group peptidase (beta-lactamase class C family)